jgi:hypothetical protein
MNGCSKPLSWIYLLATVIAGCDYGSPSPIPNFPTGTVEGYRPIYANPSDSDIGFMAARPLRHPGKIYVVADYLLVNEKFQGIHVYDNSDPSNPVPLGFVKMIGNTDVAVRNNVLYADHLSDLVAIDISDWNNLRELSRTKQNFWSQKIPPGNHKYFECVDATKGVVVGWEFAVLNNPKCFR